jgi:hypothetical protein
VGRSGPQRRMPLWQAAEVADSGRHRSVCEGVLLGLGGKSQAGGPARAGALCYCAYSGGLNAELFTKAAAVDDATPYEAGAFGGRRTHKTAPVKAYVASTHGMLTLHFLPDYAPELNPGDLVWSHTKRTGVARAPLRRGETLHQKIEAQLSAMKRVPQLYGLAFLANRHSRCGHWSCPRRAQLGISETLQAKRSRGPHRHPARPLPHFASPSNALIDAAASGSSGRSPLAVRLARYGLRRIDALPIRRKPAVNRLPLREMSFRHSSH